MQTCASLSDFANASKPIDTPNASLTRIALRAAEIEVWQAQLDRHAEEIMRFETLLSGDEKLRAERFHTARDRRRFIVARGTLRQLLGGQIEIAPAAIEFAYLKNGKPIVAGSPEKIYFNVSHSGERVLIALSRTSQVGIDIESMNRDIDCEGLARQYFTDGEAAALRQFPVESRRRAFLTCWTRKESVIKATGDGLSLPLNQFEVNVDPDSEPRILTLGASMQHTRAWKLFAVNVGCEYTSTLAAFDLKFSD